VTLPEDEQAFLCDALAQLAPDMRPVLVERVVGCLVVHPDPGPGDVDRALRAALVGLWVPPADAETPPPRWSRGAPRYERASKRAW
jgi:hypothetical protein